MDDFLKKIFLACDKDEDGFLDRSDLEEVRNQIGLADGNISEILEQYGAGETGKISFTQFCENSAILLGELSGSESSPEYYSTDSDTQQTPVMSSNDKQRFKNEESRKETTSKGASVMTSYGKESDLDLELKVSGEKIKQLSASWALASHRKSGGTGGIEDYLDPKTLQHLEELNIIDPQTKEAEFEPEPPPPPSSSSMHSKSMMPNIEDIMSGREKSGPDYLEISKQLHLAALTSYKNEIFDLNSRLQLVRGERDGLRKQQMGWNMEKQKMQTDFEDKLQSQTMRITELQSVIAELTRKLNKVNGNTIIEEEEEEEEEEEDDRSGSISDLEVQGSRACSECSCENCDHHLDEEGPNQVNLLATCNETTGSNLNITNDNNNVVTRNTNDSNIARDIFQKDVVDEVPNNESYRLPASGPDNSTDLQQQLSNVLGALESRIEDRGKYAVTPDNSNEVYNDVQNDDVESGLVLDSHDGSPKSIGNSSIKEQISELLRHVETLKRDKRSLEKQLHNISVQGYVYQKGNTTHVEEEFSKLRQENSYLRSKLRKSEQETEEVKVAHIAVKEEKERLKKQKRALQESLDGKGRDLSPIPSSNSSSSLHLRSQSLINDRPQSPSVLHRSNNGEPPRVPIHPRSNSLDNRQSPRGESPVLVHRSAVDSRKYSLPTSQSSYGVNSKGYTISPENSMRRGGGGSSGGLGGGGQHMMESSDLGSSIGDDSHKSELNRTVLRNLHGRIPDTLLQTLVTYHNLEQVLSTLVNHFLTELDEKVREGLINVERVESRMAHLQSQNDLLQLSLDESKQNAERLSLLCGKYESNSCAWSLALQNTEQLIETYEVMLQLQESEADMYAANCHVVGINNFDTIKSLTSTKSSHSNISLASEHRSEHGFNDDEEILKSYHKRKDAESQARGLLLRLDKKYENMETTTAEEELKNEESSYKSRTSTGSSQNSNCTDTLSKDEEHRLRHYIKRLKTERGIYKGTVVELESVHEYSDSPGSGVAPRSHHNEADEQMSGELHTERTHELNVDIEAAVTLQEMQALKEERAELKHRIYLLEKEKRALELKLNSREAQEQAYIVHIEHLKSEVKEQIRNRKQILKEGRRLMPGAFPSQDDESMSTSDSAHSGPGVNEVHSQPSCDEIPQDLIEATRRERKLKIRIHELVDTLEKLQKNSEIRHKQTAEYISDLKRANGALVTAYEKAKKRHASRLKKFEQQLVQMAEKYQVQVRVLKGEIANLKETPPPTVPPPAQVTQTETSL